jgi:VWA domain-containing protein
MASKKKNAKQAVETPVVETLVTEETKAPQFDELEGVAIVSTGTKTVQVEEEFEKVLDQQHESPNEPSTGASLEDIYDRYSKLVYVIDASGSMGEGMKDEDHLSMYTWPPSTFAQLRQQLAEQDGEAPEPDEFEDEEFFEEDEPEEVIRLSELSDDDLKRHIIRHGQSTRFGSDVKFNGFSFPMNSKYRGNNRSKMEILKGAAKDFVSKRFAKFKDAKVAVMQFEESPMLLCASGAIESEVLAAIERLQPGGGTDIFKAVVGGISDCKKRPSEVGAHHIVLVSDGCDGGAARVTELVPRMKEVGIVFDFIFVQGMNGDSLGVDMAKILRGVCEATGGEYTEVRTVQDFETKFLAVSNRPMLPPARS